MRTRLLIGLVPVILAGSAVLASPVPVLAADGVVDTATTTYVVNTAKSEIDVTVRLSIKNNTPPTVREVPCGWMTCPVTTDYYYKNTFVWVPAQAVSVKATADSGKVQQSVSKSNPYGRELKLTFANLFYGGIRSVTVTYAIPAGPHAPGGYRALKAYGELCASGNGYDSGSVSVVVPDGFDVQFTGGTKLTKSGDAKGVQTFGSGKVSAPSNFWTCIEASRPSGLTNASLAVGDQGFNIHAWPEDATWAGKVTSDVRADVPRLEDLTGLQMPGGTIDIQEAGDWQLGEYAGTYDSSTKMASVTENTDHATVAHELSHIWFNPAFFTDTWMNEGFAGYSEKAAGAGNYKACVDPGAYPGSGTPSLATWLYLDNNSTAADSKVVHWQYAASCYLVAQVADAIGPDNFKAVLVAASQDEIAYLGTTPAEVGATGGPPVSPETLLDLIDELGMVPAGVTDLDQAQNLFAKYGIFTPAELANRSQARSAYHDLLEAAGSWKLPMAIRSPMASWDFASAQTAMDTATQILTVRDQIEKNLPGFSPDGTALQTSFEAATTRSDLDSVLDLAKQEADAAAKVAQAKQANGGSRSIFQTIGLLGVDVSGPLTQANTALKNAKPSDASASAQKVIDAVNSSSSQGLVRVGAVLGLLVLVLIVALLIVLLLRRRGRHSAAVLVPDGQLDGVPLDGVPLDGVPLDGVPLDGAAAAPPTAAEAVVSSQDESPPAV